MVGVGEGNVPSKSRRDPEASLGSGVGGRGTQPFHNRGITLVKTQIASWEGG